MPRHHPEVVAKMKKLRWIEWWVDWKGLNESSLPTNFPPGELSCLILAAFKKRQLWKGYKVILTLCMNGRK